MSLVTCCPACGTLFRVVPDQLKLADGWVRCGQCSEVFDAQARLLDETELEAAPPASALLQRESQPMPLEPLGAAPGARDELSEPSVHPDSARSIESMATADVPSQVGQPTDADADAGAGAGAGADPDVDVDADAEDDIDSRARLWTLHAPAAPDDVLVEPIAAASLDRPTPLDENIPAAPASPTTADADVATSADAADAEPESADPAAEQATTAAVADAHAHEAPASTSASAATVAPSEVSFVRQARRRAFWHRRPVQGVLAGLASVLALLLVLQVLVHRRDEVVARAPAVRPVLDALCGGLGCRIGPPRRIEDVVIDSSNFTRLRADAYRLSLTLHNQGDLALDMPALELTLTDTADRAVVRRVLLAAEYAGGERLLPAQSEWSVAVSLGVAGDAAGARIAGYRLLAFYP